MTEIRAHTRPGYFGDNPSSVSLPCEPWETPVTRPQPRKEWPVGHNASDIARRHKLVLGAMSDGWNTAAEVSSRISMSTTPGVSQVMYHLTRKGALEPHPGNSPNGGQVNRWRLK